MLFKNLRLYRLPRPWHMTRVELDAKLRARPFHDCPASSLASAGWVPPCPAGDPEAYVIATPDLAHWLVRLRVQEKLLPGKVVKAEAARRAAEIEKAQCYKPGKQQMKAITEEAFAALLPRAFVSDRYINAWIDPVNGWLGIDSGGSANAERILDALRNTLDEFPVKMLRTARSPASLMAGWLATEPEEPFTIDQDCVLKAPTADKATIRYSHYSLDHQDVREHLNSGKNPTRLALTWADRISFVLDEKGALLKLEWLDLINRQREDELAGSDGNALLLAQAELILLGSNLAHLLADLVDNLGGEAPQEGETPEPRATRPSRAVVGSENFSLDFTDNVERDPLYTQAIMIVGMNHRPSISLVQRRLTIGYNRAARLIEQMEADGYITPMDHSGQRQITRAFPRVA